MAKMQKCTSADLLEVRKRKTRFYKKNGRFLKKSVRESARY